MSPYYQHLRTKIGRDLLLVPSVAAVILDGEGNLLLQEKHGEGWSLPAGAIEPGEAPVEALRREVLEETGLMVEPASIRGVFGGAAFRYAYPNGDVVEYTVVLFKCIVLNQFARLVGPETKSLGYFSKDELPDLALPYPYDVLFEGV